MYISTSEITIRGSLACQLSGTSAINLSQLSLRFALPFLVSCGAAHLFSLPLHLLVAVSKCAQLIDTYIFVLDGTSTAHVAARGRRRWCDRLCAAQCTARVVARVGVGVHSAAAAPTLCVH